MDFTVPTNNRLKIKENEKIVKNLDHDREWKNVLNMLVTVTTNILSTLGMVLKGLERKLGKLKIRGRIETNYCLSQVNKPEIETKTVSYRISTCVTMFISKDDKRYSLRKPVEMWVIIKEITGELSPSKTKLPSRVRIPDETSVIQ